MNTQTDIVDKVALALSGALVVIGTAVLGTVEILAGQPYGAAPVTNEAGEIVATPAVDPVIRTGVVLAGLAVLLLWGVYRAAAAEEAPERERRDVTAD
ncbi:hypothetical protein SAMN04487947_4059 [Halogeometricum rufum]|uniref:Uncharacterized protein n=1 Tax=Halogeometricum rufum TaxID=553469 RepID=A0A1I6J597_9EURY|nr:hypothetical protein [Halogeometricum rufum]SFR74108.1 hypothetical protein SAMN04487947_4059 [Halogeometricum rufum]